MCITLIKGRPGSCIKDHVGQLSMRKLNDHHAHNCRVIYQNQLLRKSGFNPQKISFLERRNVRFLAPTCKVVTVWILCSYIKANILKASTDLLRCYPLGHQDIRLAEPVGIWHYACDRETHFLIERIRVPLQILDLFDLRPCIFIKVKI